ncbi:hypothetical protein VN97_g10398 [Penicillium thymicola]|uniref:Uncharacterized protein n=1 Tax=Penicillium thymicola TaxID=293382 RepID=A0AAI9T9W2_PENTH|nr:hypothetical protein VN97_g10398 [Penicillium thymicola]
MPDPHPKVSPACPIPYVLQPEERVEQLKTYLQTEFGKIQRINVEAQIRFYESGDLKPSQLGELPVYLMDGRLVDRNPWEDPSVPDNAMLWCEGVTADELTAVSDFELTGGPIKSCDSHTVLYNIIQFRFNSDSIHFTSPYTYITSESYIITTYYNRRLLLFLIFLEDT